MEINIGQCVRKAHDRLGKKPTEIADQMGILHSNYYHLMNRKGATIDTLYKLSEAFGITMDEFVRLNHEAD